MEEALDEGVGVFAGGRDGVKGLTQAGDAKNFDQRLVFEFVSHDHAGDQGEGITLAGDEAEHGHVLDLGDDDGADAGAGEEGIELAAQVVFGGGKDDPATIEIAGEAEALGTAPVGHEAGFLFVQQAAEPGGGGVAGGGLVGEDEVEGVGLHLQQQFGEAAGADDDFGLGVIEDRAEELDLEIAGEGGDGTDADDGAAGGAVAEGIREFLAGAEDDLGVGEGDAAGLGEEEFFLGAFEERGAEFGFEGTDLDADGGGGDAEAFSGAFESAGAADLVEIAQVVVVHGSF